MTEIFLIRHGETAWNAERRLQGHLDIPLNEHGERQALAVAQALRNTPIDAIYSSDLQRARATAQPLADVLGLPLQLDEALRERCFGAFEGLLYEELEARFPEAHAQWRARDPDARFPEGERRGETLNEFYRRAVDTVGDIALRNTGRRIAIVTHGGVLDCVYRAAHGMGLIEARNFDVLNAAINRLRWTDAGFEVLAWAQSGHLGAALDELGH
jgi:probable phosphoglycerate mutase